MRQKLAKMRPASKSGSCTDAIAGIIFLLNNFALQSIFVVQWFRWSIILPIYFAL